jgi:hypothetical protein
VVALAEIGARAGRRFRSGDDVAHPRLASNWPHALGVAVPVEPNAIAEPQKQTSHWAILLDFGSEVDQY